MPVKPLLVVFLVAAVLALPPLAGPVRASDACSELAPDSPTVRLVGLDEAGDPVLADGRRLRLVGLAPRQDDAEAARFAAGIGPWRDRDLRLVLLGASDRWGRLPARLYAPAEDGEAIPRDVAAALLREGAASPLPDAGTARCGVQAQSARAKARSGRAAAPTMPVAAGATTDFAIDGHDVAALRAHEGRLVLLEGRIASVGERAQRTYLNFSRRRGEAASIVLSKRLWREMQDTGWTASGVGGKRLRARGVLSGRDGLLLDVTSKLALELVD
ncbi:hypothetical protein [Bosea sp. 124]|uniref:hypothetical protein n=1 Tax=Bosea sp. 124 TaxID=2135642 RepID=UPI000D37B24C|nr:hypothetical protein [Bosea sp. 124]PTM40636.1 hypothetical protein C8D03_2166 [Bosea sp. 124]